MRKLGRVAALAGLVGLATAGAEAHPRDPLKAAGFFAKRADTPRRQAMLMTLPPHRFLRHYHGRELFFVYADPAGCDCLYLGDPHAFHRYWRRTADPAGRSEEHQAFLWDWDAWGRLPNGFHWGPALGW